MQQWEPTNLQSTAPSSAENMCLCTVTYVTVQPTSTKVSAQTRERTVRIAVVPFPRRPTLHWRVQHSELEQDCRKKEEGVGGGVLLTLNYAFVKILITLKS